MRQNIARISAGLAVRPVLFDFLDQSAENYARLFAELDALRDIAYLVNNVGMNKTQRFSHLAGADAARIMLLNAFPMVALCDYIFARRHEPRCTVINMGSVVSKLPSPFVACYTASKGFVYEFSKSLRGAPLAQGRQVKVLCALPWEVRTQMINFQRGLFVISPEQCARSLLRQSRRDFEFLATHGHPKHELIGWLLLGLHKALGRSFLHLMRLGYVLLIERLGLLSYA